MELQHLRVESSLHNTIPVEQVVVNLQAGMVPSNDFEAEPWLCHGTQRIVLFFVSDRSRNLPCERGTSHILHEAIVHIFQVLRCNQASFKDGAPLQHDRSETLRTAQTKANSKTNCKMQNFVPVSYIVVARWQGQRRLLVAFDW